MMPRNRYLIEDRIDGFVDGRPEPRRAEAGGGSVKREPQAVGAAGGGGEDRPLVTMANRSSNSETSPPQTSAIAAQAQALIRETCGDLPEAKRISPHAAHPDRGRATLGWPSSTAGPTWSVCRRAGRCGLRRVLVQDPSQTSGRDRPGRQTPPGQRRRSAPRRRHDAAPGRRSSGRLVEDPVGLLGATSPPAAGGRPSK